MSCLVSHGWLWWLVVSNVVLLAGALLFGLGYFLRADRFCDRERRGT